MTELGQPASTLSPGNKTPSLPLILTVERDVGELENVGGNLSFDVSLFKQKRLELIQQLGLHSPQKSTSTPSAASSFSRDEHTQTAVSPHRATSANSKVSASNGTATRNAERLKQNASAPRVRRRGPAHKARSTRGTEAQPLRSPVLSTATMNYPTTNGARPLFPATRQPYHHTNDTHEPASAQLPPGFHPSTRPNTCGPSNVHIPVSDSPNSALFQNSNTQFNSSGPFLEPAQSERIWPPTQSVEPLQNRTYQLTDNRPNIDRDQYYSRGRPEFQGFSRLAHLESSLLYFEAELPRLDKDNQRLQQQNQNMRQLIQDRLQENQTLLQTNQELMSDNQKSKGENQKSLRQVEKLKAEIKTQNTLHQEELQRLSQQIKRAEDKAKQLEMEKRSLQQEITRFSGQSHGRWLEAIEAFRKSCKPKERTETQMVLYNATGRVRRDWEHPEFTARLSGFMPNERQATQQDGGAIAVPSSPAASPSRGSANAPASPAAATLNILQDASERPSSTTDIPDQGGSRKRKSDALCNSAEQVAPNMSSHSPPAAKKTKTQANPQPVEKPKAQAVPRATEELKAQAIPQVAEKPKTQATSQAADTPKVQTLPPVTAVEENEPEVLSPEEFLLLMDRINEDERENSDESEDDDEDEDDDESEDDDEAEGDDKSEEDVESEEDDKSEEDDESEEDEEIGFEDSQAIKEGEHAEARRDIEAAEESEESEEE